MTKTKRTVNGHPRSVISYLGGKSQLIDHIVPLLTYAAASYQLTHYYELFAGGARMLLNLPTTRFAHRHYHEMDLGLCKLFACLGSKEYVYDLQMMLEEWGVSEETFDNAKQSREFETRMLALGREEFEMSMLHGAACAFVVTMMSRASDANSFDHSRVTDSRRQRAYFKRVKELDLYYPTLEGVTVTQGDGRERLEQVKHDSNTMIYLDPPYMPSEMAMKTANHYGTRSWTQADHERLVDSLLTVNGAKVVLSGYDHEIYRRLEEAHWTRVYLKEVYVSSSTIARRWKEEYVWINFPLPPSLFEKVSAYDYGKW